MTGATLDFLARGTFLQPDGDGTQDNLFTLAEENGFTLVDTAEEYATLSSESGRTLAINPTIAEDSAMLYEIDRIRRSAEAKRACPWPTWSRLASPCWTTTKKASSS